MQIYFVESLYKSYQLSVSQHVLPILLVNELLFIVNIIKQP